MGARFSIRECENVVTVKFRAEKLADAKSSAHCVYYSSV